MCKKQFLEYFSEESCKSCSSKLKADKCHEFDECSSHSFEYFKAGFEANKKEYEEKLRWIPVEKELPKNYSAVLAVIKSPSCTWVEEIGYGEGKFQLPGRGNTDFVTHWMYLPEPPPFL